MCEEDTRDYSIEILKQHGYTTENGFIIEKEKSACSNINHFLRSASKNINPHKKPRIGRPDIIIRSQEKYPDIIILVECKKYLKNHQPNSDDLLCLDNPEKYATSGVLRYMEAFHNESKHKFNIIGIAISGNEHNCRIASFGIKKNFLWCFENIKILHNRDICSIEDYIKKIFTIPHIRVLYQCKQNKIYLATVNKIFSIVRFPKWQRPFDNTHANRLGKHYNHEYHNNATIYVPCLIYLGQDINNYKDIYVIDGQHRLYALSQLCKKKHIDIRIRVEVFTGTLDEIKRQYKLHNRAKALTHADKDTINNIDNCEHKQMLNKILTDTMNKLYDNYKAMFSKSTRPLIPNLNKDNVFNEIWSILSNNDKYSKTIIDNPDKIYKDIMNLNEKIKLYPESKLPKKNITFESRQYKKCIKHDLYVGLYPNNTWVNLIINIV